MILELRGDTQNADEFEKLLRLKVGAVQNYSMPAAKAVVER